MPDKPVPGTLYQFASAIPGIIDSPGVWVYKLVTAGHFVVSNKYYFQQL